MESDISLIELYLTENSVQLGNIPLSDTVNLPFLVYPDFDTICANEHISSFLKCKELIFFAKSIFVHAGQRAKKTISLKKKSTTFFHARISRVVRGE
jgi:hypothetical protein